jgi:DNA-binding Lrp family transcriptional regulator
MADIEEKIIKTLQAAGKPLSAEEISRRTGISGDVLSKTIEVLIRRRKMISQNRQYTLVSNIMKVKQDIDRGMIDNTR